MNKVFKVSLEDQDQVNITGSLSFLSDGRYRYRSMPTDRSLVIDKTATVFIDKVGTNDAGEALLDFGIDFNGTRISSKKLLSYYRTKDNESEPLVQGLPPFWYQGPKSGTYESILKELEQVLTEWLSKLQGKTIQPLKTLGEGEFMVFDPKWVRGTDPKDMWIMATGDAKRTIYECVDTPKSKE